MDNKLSLHVGKTECLIFGSKRKLSRVKDFAVEYDSHVVKGQKSVCYLGITLDQDLSGESIVSNIISKVNSRLKFLYRKASFLTSKYRQTLCQSLIQCHFDYCCASWFDGLSKASKNKLQVAQNKIARFIKNLEPRSHIGSYELGTLNLLNVESRVKQLQLNHVHKVFNQTCPPYMSYDFKRVMDVHSHDTRGSSSNFVVPKSNATIQKTFLL